MKNIYKIEFLILVIIIIFGGVFFFYTQRTKVIKINKDGIEDILIHKNTAIIRVNNNSQLMRKIKEDMFHYFEPITEIGPVEDIFGEPTEKDEEDKTWIHYYYEFPSSIIEVSPRCYDNGPCAEWYLRSYPKDLNYKDFFSEYILDKLPDNINIDVVSDNSSFVFIIVGDEIKEISWR
ncbi:hypothetical protein HOB10_00705 [Candidatus Parcubacteria bacterium]|jgi:hypothetical protein|nr:hypothetical protein [Candidatus Parcubacteria bacterium]